VYDHDPEEVENLGWEEFITRQWESIFVGYRSWVGLRAMGRRWSDFFEAGLNCSQDVADRLARDVIINGPDRRLEDAADAQALVSGMIDVLADVQISLADMGDVEPKLSAWLLDQQAQLLSFVRVHVLGQDEVEPPVP
jgi:hypothetical protein